MNWSLNVLVLALFVTLLAGCAGEDVDKGCGMSYEYEGECMGATEYFGLLTCDELVDYSREFLDGEFGKVTGEWAQHKSMLVSMNYIAGCTE